MEIAVLFGGFTGIKLLGDPDVKEGRTNRIGTTTGLVPVCLAIVLGHLPPDGFFSPALAAGVFFLPFLSGAGCPAVHRCYYWWAVVLHNFRTMR